MFSLFNLFLRFVASPLLINSERESQSFSLGDSQLIDSKDAVAA